MSGICGLSDPSNQRGTRNGSGYIAYIVSLPNALERCVEQRYQQVLRGHRLSDGQIRDDVRVSERNKATNYCNGGTGQLHWQP